MELDGGIGETGVEFYERVYRDERRPRIPTIPLDRERTPGGSAN